MKRRRHIKEILICILICVIPVLWGISHVQHFEYVDSLFEEAEEDLLQVRDMHNGVETITIKDYLKDAAGGSYYMTKYLIPNGDTVISGSLHGATKEPVILQSLHIVGDAKIHYYDEGKFGVYDLEEGKYEISLFFIDSNDFDVACYQPRQYVMLENEALDYLPEKDGYLSVKKTSDGFDIELFAGEVGENCCTDFMLVYSNEDIMDWSSNKVDEEWLSFTMDNDKRWTYTGYYRISPETYYPTGPNVFYKCQACYLGDSFVNANPRYRVMDDMLFCILDTMSRQQNQVGFFPSTSRSNWLYEDFNVDAFYYDTRFNSDLMEIFIRAYDIYLNSACYKSMDKYADFYLNLANTIGRDDGEGGIWIPDYWTEDAKVELIHTSLNHQLAEMSVLYKLSDLLNRPELETLANKMLKAIENSGAGWIKANYDLEYCINPDGTYGRPDYDELTYNDMFKMQILLEERYGKRNDTLDMLMKSKLVWMDNNNVTTYLK